MSEIHGATGSYVVNALDPDELDEFEAHLAVCPTCRQEVVEFCETAAELSLLAAAPPPPPALREAVLSGIAGVRQLPPVPGNPRRAVPSDEEPEEEPLPPAALARADDREDRVVDELALRRASRRTRLLSVLVAAVAVVALALGGTVWGLVRQQQPAAAGPSADTSLLAAPDAKLVKTTVDGAAVSFVVSKAQNRALFVGGDLPSPGVDKTYQAWTLRGSAATPDATLDSGTNVSQWLHGPVSDSTGLAITIEPRGGSQKPTLPILATASI